MKTQQHNNGPEGNAVLNPPIELPQAVRGSFFTGAAGMETLQIILKPYEVSNGKTDFLKEARELRELLREHLPAMTFALLFDRD